MMLWLLASIALPTAATWLLLRATRPTGATSDIPAPTAGDAALRLGLAIGIGVGATACVYALVALAGGGRAAVIAVDGALCATVMGLALRDRSPARAVALPPWRRIDLVLTILVFTAATAAAAAFAVNSAHGPHGEWDAMAIWNLRARCLVRAGTAWKTCFSDALVHTDYPLLLPSAVARLWVWSGGESTLAPILLAALFPAALLLVLYGAITRVRGRTLGLLAALSLLGTPVFLTSLDWQYADIPLAFFLLAGLALLAQRDTDTAPRPGTLLWAGVAAGLAAWTKNEGALMLLCIVAARSVGALRHRQMSWRGAGWWTVGALPPLLLLLVFKLTLAPPSELTNGQSAATYLARLAEPTRYALIAAAAAGQLAHSVGLLALALALAALLLGRTPDVRLRRAAGAAMIVVSLVAGGYAGVYLLTPSDLSWHLQHSLDRLILQLWPSLLFALFLSARSPLEAAALRPQAPAARREKNRARRAG